MLENQKVVQYERKITPIERMFHRSPYSIVTLVARIKGNVTEDMLVKAVAKVQHRHPNLRVRIMDDNIHNPWFISQGAKEIQIEIVPRESDDDWIQVHQQASQIPFEFEARPAIRFILVQSPKVSELIILCHHIICDGMSLAYLARDIMELMLAEQRKVLSKLGVRFDRWFYESSLHKQKRIEGIIKELSKRGVTFEEEGALWFKSKELGDDKNRVLVREDGASTYFASDIAYHVDKFRRKYDLLINVWGTDHHGYVARLKAAVKFLGFPVEKLKIIIGQLVSLFRAGEPVKMSKRAGEMVTLEEVIDEIGVDATRFFFLMTSPDTHLDFDLELAKKHSSDNPVYYVQYAHARISSILREAEKSGHNIKKAVRTADLELLNDPEEIILIKKIVSFPDEILESARALLPHRLINYSRELSAQFHNFYHKLRVLSSDQDLTRSRLALVFATRIVLRNVLKLLGISAPESM